MLIGRIDNVIRTESHPRTVPIIVVVIVRNVYASTSNHDSACAEVSATIALYERRVLSNIRL